MKIIHAMWRQQLLKINTYSEEDVLLGPGSQKALLFLFKRCHKGDFLGLWKDLQSQNFTNIISPMPWDLENILCEFYKFMKAIDIINK